MLTLFSHFKPFQGHFGVIQGNAARSWARLHPEVDLIFFGDREGTAAMAAEVEARHVPGIGQSEHGTASMRSLFEQAAELARNDVLCFVNGDILLQPDLLEAVNAVPFADFLLVGRRTELDLSEPLDFSSQWRAALQDRLRADSYLQRDVAIDYFVLPRALVPRLEMPDFSIGRPRWDNWTLFRIRQLGVPLIDATEVVQAVHQIHDYSHHAQGRQGVLDEGKDSLRAAGGKQHLFFIRDATHRLTSDGLRRNRQTPWARRFDTLAVLHPWARLPLAALRRSGRWLRKEAPASS